LCQKFNSDFKNKIEIKKSKNESRTKSILDCFLIILNKNDVNKIPDRARQLLRDLMGLFLGLSDLCPTLR